jgi:AraC-like DNA-binding protein
LLHDQEALLEQDDVGGFLGDIDRGVDRDTDIGGLERRTIVDAVAEEPDHMTLEVERADDSLFLARRKLCEHGGAVSKLGELAVVHLLDLTAEQHHARIDLHFAADFAGDDFIVAGQDLDLHALFGECGNRRSGGILGRIEKGDIAEQCEIALVGDGIGCFRIVYLLVSDGDNAKAVLIECDRFFLGSGKVAFIERTLRVTVAGALRLSPRYLQKIFADRDETLSRVIKARRIAEARRLLECGEARKPSVAQVAYAVGFDDVAHFSRAFREVTGMAPSAYRGAEV